MKAQTVLVAAYLSVVLAVLILAVLYFVIFPLSNNYSVTLREINVIRIIRGRSFWEPKELAMKISSKFGADYVYVEVTVIDIVSNTIKYHDSYNITPIGFRIDKLSVYRYTYSRMTRNGTMLIYRVEVGYK